MEELLYFIIVVFALIAVVAISIGIRKCLCGSSEKAALTGATPTFPDAGFPNKKKNSMDYFGRPSSSSSSSSSSSRNRFPDATGPADDATGPADDDATGPADDATGANDGCFSVHVSCSNDCKDASKD